MSGLCPVRRLSPEEIGARIDELAALRIAVFRDWPYLYAGTPEDEREYLAVYRDPSACVLVAERGSPGGMVVGTATALALTSADPDFAAPFAGSSFDPAELFYFGESVLRPESRGAGVGREFMRQREHVAREGGFRFAAFCSVIRAADDPRRPAGARSLEDWWRRCGYEPTGIVCTFRWREVDGQDRAENRLRFWIRELR